jgi:3-hydroxymyristoyl/3-hydroxydecanoyl-(acyl carrier protein) dehydratase
MKFRLVDKITEYSPHRFITGEKALSLEEFFLLRPLGHQKILPPTLMAEALFQLSNFLIFKSFGTKLGHLVMFEKIHFHGTMQPGDVLAMRVDMTRVIDDAVMLNGSGSIDGKVAIEGFGCIAKLIEIETLVNPVKFEILFNNLFSGRLSSS